jgi:hypothetical protein
MTLADEIKEVLEDDEALVELLTGGVWTGIEEINRQLAPEAFDENMEILPSVLIKLGVEIPSGPYLSSVQTPVVMYFYQRQGYDDIEPAMRMVFDLLNEQTFGTAVWNIRHSNTVYDQRDIALDCALMTLRMVATRSL